MRIVGLEPLSDGLARGRRRAFYRYAWPHLRVWPIVANVLAACHHDRRKERRVTNLQIVLTLLPKANVVKDGL
jgi:hypothetical protein